MISARLAAIAIAAALLAAAVTPAAAAPAFGCYARAYDAAHLAAHPKQTVTAVALRLKPLRGQSPLTATALATFHIRGHRASELDGGDCQPSVGDLHCGMDEDAGAFTLSPAPGGLKLTVTATLRLNRADQGSDESNGPYVDPANPEDRTYLLAAAPPSACR